MLRPIGSRWRRITDKGPGYVTVTGHFKGRNSCKISEDHWMNAMIHREVFFKLKDDVWENVGGLCEVRVL